MIVLGLVLYVARGYTAVLVFHVIGVILLIGGVIYKPKQKKVEVEGNAEN